MKPFRLTVIILFAVVACIFTAFFLSAQFADKTVPVITVADELINVSLDAGDDELKAGVTASDAKDGDLTDKVIVESVSKFVEPGISLVTYAVCDSDNHVVTASRWIFYPDYTKPRFTMEKPPVYSLSETISVTGILGASDVIDGDISDKIIVTVSENESSSSGIFYISAQVTNSMGDKATVALPVYVENISAAAPDIVLKDYLIYLKTGEAYDVAANCLSATDSQKQDLSAAVTVDSDLDNNRAGTYQVHYYVSDAAGRTAHSVLTVIVEG